jgi:hypothetical protein
VLAWRWDTAADAREFLPAIREYIGKGLKGRAEGENVWDVEGSAVALAADRRETTLAFAPTADLARRLAARAPVRR